MSRDYGKENRDYKSKPDQIEKRVKRNKLRKKAIKEGRAKVGDGTSVEHIKPLSKGGSDSPKNTKIVSFEDNSSFDRNSDKSVRKNTPGIFKKKKLQSGGSVIVDRQYLKGR
jgi:ribosomal protein S17|tara:strand:+ start:2329 stop:2664 length:336 start_codon:yes stop_codon:yes gene_type:complete